MVQRVTNTAKNMKQSHEAPSDEAITPKRDRVASTGNPQLMKRYPISFSTRECMMPESYEQEEKKMTERTKKIPPKPRCLLATNESNI